MRHSTKILGTGIIAALIGWGAWHHYSAGEAQSKSAKEKSGASTPVGVAHIKTGDINVYLTELGNVTPPYTITVHTMVDGELMRLDFREGQRVKANDLLAELDARPYQAQLEQAQGELIRDTALLKEARVDLQRYKTLYAQDSIAKQQLDLQDSLVKQYEGDVKNDQGLIDTAKVNILYTRITAPVSGRVGLRQVDPGNIVHTTDTNGIVVVTQLQPITVIFTVPEDNIPSVTGYMKKTKKLLAEAWDRAGDAKLATGVLTAIDNVVDPTTGMVKFRAEFPNKDNALFPSQFVNVKLRLDTLHNALLAPGAAIQRGTQGTFVYLVKPDNTVAVQPVTIGPAEGENVAVQKGLAAGDTVVIDGSDNLRDGAKISIAEPVAKTAAPKANANSSGDSSGHRHKKHSGDDAQ